MCDSNLNFGVRLFSHSNVSLAFFSVCRQMALPELYGHNFISNTCLSIVHPIVRFALSSTRRPPSPLRAITFSIAITPCATISVEKISQRCAFWFIIDFHEAARSLLSVQCTQRLFYLCVSVARIASSTHAQSTDFMPSNVYTRIRDIIECLQPNLSWTVRSRTGPQNEISDTTNRVFSFLGRHRWKRTAESVYAQILTFRNRCVNERWLRYWQSVSILPPPSPTS